MKKALILGTNAGQADIINYLVDIGWIVHSCGHKAEGPGMHLAHKFHKVNTINVDDVTDLAKKINADIIYSVSSDVNIRTATKASEVLGLPVLVSSEIIDIFHFKDNLRNFLNHRGISPVSYLKVRNVEEAAGWSKFPCVVKPSDSQGQRGIDLITEKNKLNAGIHVALKNSTTSSAILEEYLEGVEISTNMIVQSGRILINEFTERLVHGIQYFGLPKGHCIPVRNITGKELEEASKMVTRLVKELKLNNAVLYIQMKVTGNGPKIVEVAPRLDGCHIWRLLKQAKGYDLRKFAIDCLTDTKIIHTESIYENVKNYTLAFHQLRTGATFNSKNLERPLNLKYNEYRYKENEAVQPVNGVLEVVGYYIKED